MGTSSPIDGRRAWIVLVGCFIINLLDRGYNSSFWQLFEMKQELYRFWDPQFGDVTSAVVVVRVVVHSISAFVSTNVMLEFVTERVVVVLGGAVLAAGVMVTNMAGDMILFVVTTCVVAGMGQGFLYGPGVVMLGKYFNKHRPLAMAIASVGLSAGPLTLPSLVPFLIGEYTWRGTSLILGAILLNTVAAGALYRPLSLDKVQQAQQASQALLQHQEDSKGEDKSVQLPLLRVDIGDPEHSVSIEHGSNALAATGSQSKSTASPDAPRHRSTSDLRPESTSLIAPPTSADTDPRSLTESSTRRHVLARTVAICGFSLFKKPLFRVILFCSISIAANLIPAFFLPDLALEKGMSGDEVFFMMMLTGALSIVGRLGMGVLVSLRLVPAHYIAAASFLLLGVACQLTRLYVSFPLLVLFSVLYGLLGGAYFVLLPIIIIDFLGLQNLAKTFGFVQLFTEVFSAAMYPLVGLINNMTGSYDMSFNIAGACALLAFAALLVEPLLRKRPKTAQ